MATNEIEIEVTLDDKNALKGLDKLEKAGESVGEGFSALGSSVSAMGGELNETLGSLGESVGGVASSMTGLTQAAKGAGGSFTAMIGPIGAVAVAIASAYHALQDYIGASRDAEIRTEAYKASAAELTAFIEELAVAQVKLNAEQIRELDELTREAKFRIERAQLIREENAERRSQIDLLAQEIDVLKAMSERARATFGDLATLGMSQMIEAKLKAQEKLQAKVNKTSALAIGLAQEGASEFAKAEARKEELLKQAPEFREQVEEKERQLLEQAQADRLARVKDSAEAQIVTAVTASERKVREINKIEDVAERAKNEAIAAERERLQAQIDDINKKAADKRRAEQAKRLADQRARAAKELALERLKQAELARIRRAEIEQLKISGSGALEVLQLQYDLEVELAGDNQRKLTALELEFENRRTVIVQEEERKRQEAARVAAEEEQRKAQQRQAFILSSLEFDARMMEDGLDKELTLLDLKYRREVELAEHSQEELTELQRRHEAERLAITERSVKTQIETLAQYTSTVSQGLAESAYNAALFGESFSQSIGEVLVSLGRQAGVESLMELARGTAALFLNPALASNHFIASGIFGAAAAVAGSAGAALGGGGGGGGGASVAARGASPSGAPQTAPAPERERAESTSMVFNINFGNSTIYDTKRAAQDAMASEIMRTMNRQRRGSPRFMGV
jgi:hypothetical protein